MGVQYSRMSREKDLAEKLFRSHTLPYPALAWRSLPAAVTCLVSAPLNQTPRLQGHARLPGDRRAGGSHPKRISRGQALPPLPALSATLTHSLTLSLSLPARLAAVLRERVVQHQDLPGRARGSVSRAQLHRRGTRTHIRTHAHACVAVLTLCLQELSAVGQASAGIEGRSDQQHSHRVPMSAFLSDKAAEAALKKGTYVPEHLHKSPIRPGPVSSVFLSVP